jgi:DNA-binding transcriptional regulator YdaS (Cro superfamily)
MDKTGISSDSTSALERASKAVGGDTKLAEAINEAALPMPAITPKGKGHVGKWHARGGVVPPEVVLRIEAATDGEVTRHELRPDVFGFEPIAVPARKLEAAE